MLSPQQITQFRTQAGLSPTAPAPTTSGANDIIAQRKLALGMTDANPTGIPQPGGISVTPLPTSNDKPFTSPFTVNTNNFGAKDIPAGVGATMGNAILAPATAVYQASRMPEQIKDIFTQNGGEGAYGKYAEGTRSIVEGINKAIFDPIVSGLNTLGNTGLGAIQAGVKKLTGVNVGDKNAEEAFNNIGPNTANAASDVAKFGIEQPTTAALATEQAYSSLTKSATNPNPDLIHEVGGRVVDATKTAANKIADLAQPTIDAIKERAGNIANSLEQQSMRLTPIQKAKLGTRLDEVSQFNIDNGITGSPQTRLAKVNDVVGNYNQTMDDYLKNEVPDNTVKTQVLEDRLNNLKIKYSASDEANLEGMGKEIDQAVARLDGYGDTIKVPRLNNLKSSYYDNSYGNQIGSGLTDEVQGDIARVYKEAIEENLGDRTINGQSIHDFNHDYGTAVTSQRILNAAIGKPQLGPIARLASKAAGVAAGTVAGIPGEIIGGLYGDKFASLIAGTHARSIMAELLSGGDEPYLPSSDSLPPNQTTVPQANISNIPPANNINSIPSNPSTLDWKSQAGFIKNPLGSDETPPGGDSMQVIQNRMATANSPSSEMNVINTPKAGSVESLGEQAGGWKAGMKQTFDTALNTKDATLVQQLLPEVPPEYLLRFSKEINKLLAPLNKGYE